MNFREICIASRRRKLPAPLKSKLNAMAHVETQRYYLMLANKLKDRAAELIAEGVSAGLVADVIRRELIDSGRADDKREDV